MSSERLVLGTVQLGMPYGIANTTGQPDRLAEPAHAANLLDLPVRLQPEPDLVDGPAHGQVVLRL